MRVPKVVNALILKQIAVGYLITASIDTSLTVEEYIRSKCQTGRRNCQKNEYFIERVLIVWLTF